MKRSDFSKIFPKGSVLVFSLLILSILLVTSLTILSTALLDRKASLSTGSSARSFQVADSGVEEILYQVYKANHTTLADLADAITGATCSGSTVSFPSAGGEVKVTFYEDETTPYSGGCTTGTDWRTRVVKIKSEGMAGSTTRAVEVAVAAAASPLESKAWVSWSRSSGILADEGIATVTLSSNRPVITFDSPMTSNRYSVICNATLGAGTEEQVFAYNKTVTSFNLQASHAAGEDAINFADCVIFGN